MGVYFSISALLFLIVFASIFFLKGKIQNKETKIYGKLLLVTIIGLILEIVTCIWYQNGADISSFLYQFVSKVTASYYLVWSYLLCSYSMGICDFDSKKQKIIARIFPFIYVLVLILPIEYTKLSSTIVPGGMSVNLIYLVCIIFTCIDFYLCIRYRKEINKSKFTPLYAFILIGSINFILTFWYQELFLLGFIFALVTFIMYFTIENPDVKMITELNKNRLLVNQTNEEKSNFLFLASNQIKEPIKKIQELSHNSYSIKNINDLQEVVKEINNLSHSLSYQVENVMDISTLTNSNIKKIENKYNLNNLIEKVRLQKEKNISSKVDFRVNIGKNMPKYLYGDSKLLEQIISSVLNNAIKYTDEGFIELNVNTITKYDMCRLMIEVADSGCGMSIDKVNDLLMLDEPLQEKEQSRLETGDVDINTIKKIVSKMGGYFTIKSEENRGSEVKIVIDQKMDMEGNIEFDKYLAKEKALIASNDMSFLNSLIKLIREHGLEVETSIYANDVLDRIRIQEEFSYIFLDDNLDKRALEVLKELKKNPKFKAKVIVMLNKDTEVIKEHFISDGFSDYLIKDNLLEEVNRILK